MIQPEFDMIIVGGGVIGLAILHRAVEHGLNAVLLERHETCGRGISSRNSEIVHSGIYYPPGSLKARLCVAGRRQLYDFARENDIPHTRCGKAVVAVSEWEERNLEEMADNGGANGVEGLRFLSMDELADFAPGARAVSALYSPETGVINAHLLMRALQRRAEEGGGTVVCGAEVVGVGRTFGGWEVDYVDEDGETSISAMGVVNAAGLGAQNIMRMAGLDPDAADLTLYPCKGSYFSVRGEARKHIRGLLYPTPRVNLQGLGIHTLIDFGGGVKLGPDAEYIPEADEYDYSVRDELGDLFYASAYRYLPFLRREDITPDMSGVRPKLSGPGQPPRDFHIAHETMWGLEGFINLAGIESPGLTACLAIGDMVAGMFEDE